MRLRNIKLSGFKSFVDPTTLTVPGQIVGIVGPNGCGKSNIIDAVTWVMGESSAKHLRGDSLTDVIFNGSNTRQPVGQAAVELIFDNSEKKIGGEYASYNEISIKRQINREAVSTYYLNGSRCRRRDITDLFLGTGLGPRGYSIIEQGMISRLIEAKPEELRVFIEEAAGISKYRERRRETENRIRHTKENLARLNDIQEELAKQLAHLHRQAKAAERYKILKAEERELEAQLLALNWKELKERSEEEDTQKRDAETQLESAIAKLRQTETEIEQQRTALADANDAFNLKQSEFYQVGADISQLEQNIKHNKERIENNRQELDKARAQLSEINQHFQQDKSSLNGLIQQTAELEPRLQGSRSESDKAYEGLNLAEQAMQSWQSEWDRFNETAADYERQTQVNEARKEYLQDGLEELEYRLQSLREESDAIDISALENDLTEKKQVIVSTENTLVDLEKSLQQEKQSLEGFKTKQENLNSALNQLREDKQRSLARLEALKALQESAYGADDTSIKNWLSSQQLENAQRLAQRLEMDNDWATALEIVISDHLQAICVDDISRLTDKLSEINSGKIEFIQSGSGDTNSVDSKWTPLADKITQPVSLKHLVSNVFIANSVEEAMTMRQELSADQSVVTREGVCLGRDWLRLVKNTDNDASLIAREQEIQILNTQLLDNEKQVDGLEKELLDLKSNIANQTATIAKSQNNIQKQQTELSEQKGELVAAESKLEQTRERADRIQEQLDELDNNRQRDRDELEKLDKQLSESTGFNGELQGQKEQLVTKREEHRQSLDGARSKWQTTHEQSHGIALQLEALSSQKASLEQAIKRNDIQLQHTQRRCQELENAANESAEPLKGLEAQLEARLKDKISAEQALSSARKVMEDIDTQIRALEKNRSESEQESQNRRDSLEKIRMATQETEIRLKTIEEQFTAKEQDLKQVLGSLPEEANQEDWQAQLDSIARKVQRLGPINLAAIDEHSQLSERKEYLDSQEADLGQALETLEGAIRKIDLETKTRFRETFDQLNANLKDTFPQIFGGGSAYLEMTSEDLLETGVTVMARPPGKRNTTIHLLSGGEKALTAVALVFSIFKLNPAPFCILDEVDAPLDDANAARFSQLVKSMSDDVQFIVITHNKITMEIAQQLSGVTMHEPGVSRLVTVDVDAAVEMAATA